MNFYEAFGIGHVIFYTTLGFITIVHNIIKGLTKPKNDSN